jgi:ribonuclease BN (tRNA processing enzyme)
MKIKFLGTGTLTSQDRAVSSYLIDNEMLFDIGGGTVRQLQKYKIDTSKIRNIIISHYHADHLFDLPSYIVRRNLLSENGDDLVIIGPPDVEETVSKIRDICSSGLEHLWDFPTINIKFAGIANGETYTDNDIDISAYSVTHAKTRPCHGYVFKQDDTTIGFSGDASKCDGLDRIVEHADVLLIDANGPEPDEWGFHLGLSGVLEYAKQYPNKKFHLIHRGDYELPDLPSNVFAPSDGDEIEI